MAVTNSRVSNIFTVTVDHRLFRVYRHLPGVLSAVMAYAPTMNKSLLIAVLRLLALSFIPLLPVTPSRRGLGARGSGQEGERVG